MILLEEKKIKAKKGVKSFYLSTYGMRSGVYILLEKLLKAVKSKKQKQYFKKFWFLHIRTFFKEANNLGTFGPQQMVLNIKKQFCTLGLIFPSKLKRKIHNLLMIKCFEQPTHPNEQMANTSCK